MIRSPSGTVPTCQKMGRNVHCPGEMFLKSDYRDNGEEWETIGWLRLTRAACRVHAGGVVRLRTFWIGWRRGAAVAGSRVMLCVSLGCLAGVFAGCGSKAETGVGRRADLLMVPAVAQRLVVDGRRGEVVATTGGRTFTRGFVERWMPLEVVWASRYRTRSAVPAGFVPDAPTYRYCVRYLEAVGRRSARGASQAELTHRCVHEREVDLFSTLSHLLRYAWVYEEAARRHAVINVGRVARETDAKGVSQAVLDGLGVPRGSLSYAVGAELLTTKMVSTLPVHRRVQRRGHETFHEAEEADAEAWAFYQAMVRRGRAKTFCQPGFVIHECGDYEPAPL